MKKLTLIITTLCIANFCFAQKKLIQKVFSNEKDTTRNASFMPIPVLGYSQEIGFEFGFGSIYSFYIDKADKSNRSSNFFVAGSYSTKQTYNVTLKGDAWTKQNKTHLIGEIKFRNMPFNFYGIGNNTLASDEDKIVQKSIRINFDAEKEVAKNTYTGLSVGYENYKLTDKVADGIFATANNIYDKQGSGVLFVGVSQSYDTRNSNNYPSKGFFGRISYQYAPDVFGGESFTGSKIRVNLRNFWPISAKLILGAQAMYNSTQGSKTPFYLLPQLGNDELMRGYYNGRFRDENLFATQAELRYRFIERLGLVAFVGAGKVFANRHTNLKDLKPNYGFGGRYFFDPAKGLSIRLDYGVGEKRPNEKRQSGMYISLAEAF